MLASLLIHATLFVGAPFRAAMPGISARLDARLLLRVSGAPLAPESAISGADRILMPEEIDFPAGTLEGEGPNSSRSTALVGYYPIEKLDIRPWIKTRVNPEPPLVALTTTRKVRFVLAIDETGRVEDIRLTESSGDTLIDEAAMKPFTNAEFTPGYFGKRAVKTLLPIEVSFQPD